MGMAVLAEDAALSRRAGSGLPRDMDDMREGCLMDTSYGLRNECNCTQPAKT